MKRGARAIGLTVLLAALAGCAQGGPSAIADAGAASAQRRGQTASHERYDAEQLVGITDNKLLKTFGPPAQLRREPPAEVWQYRSPRCVVDFYLYQVKPVGLSVVHLEARSPVSGSLPVDSCLPGL
ncbi:hypothetical protein SAMN06265365_102444 [Tistlia consotensis]|uniref:SmpA / OmlA family protein n=1 Tax=Tistlia consotensis USBA 355 TaxID=560819 RepID=A0A1Y6C0Q0_9PROT|nr:hypothetical protein [Tistlia consotensis]SMF38355.1 hypothetical protein SAMN05428998_11319 [Tistlia consotensis USBA 355]SNR37218.1 hypothetical protein SAMN06265365_102444 [Tistlia consotensis]